MVFIAFELAITEHAGESGVQLSVGVEMEGYDNQAAAASNQLCCKREEPSRKPYNHQHWWHALIWQSQTFSYYFSGGL